MSGECFDVIIVGGGPGGLSAGIILARNGLRTLVCEKKGLPADKACGEGLLPAGLLNLDLLGGKRLLRDGDYFPFRGIRYITPDGKSAQAEFREGPGWGIPRLRLSAALLERAKQQELLEVRERAPAEGFERQAGWISADIGGARIKARLLIGADGLNSSVRRWAGLEGKRSHRQRWGTRQHFAISPWSDYVEVYWGNGIEAYVTPCGPELVSVAFIWDHMQFSPAYAGRRISSALLEPFQFLRERLACAPGCDFPRSIGPLQRDVPVPISEGVLLLGDAAGYLDPITGEGISLAFAQAFALEQTVVPVLRSSVDLGRLLTVTELQHYSRQLRRICRPNRMTTQMVLALSQFQNLIGLTVRLFAWQPWIFQRLLSLNMGENFVRLSHFHTKI